MKKCKQCGHLNNDDAPYCGNCGSKLDVIEINNVIICPECGRTYTNPNIKKCLSCGHVLINKNKTTCPHCGTENALASKYCSSCGRPLSKDKPGIKCIKCGSVNDIGNAKCVVCGAPLYEEQDIKLDEYRSNKKYRKHGAKHEGVLKNLVMIVLFALVIVSLFLPFFSIRVDGLQKIFCSVDNMSYALRSIGYTPRLYNSDKMFNVVNPLRQINVAFGKTMSVIGWIFIAALLISIYQIVRHIIRLITGNATKEENPTFLYLTIVIGLVSSILFLFAFNAGQTNVFGTVGDYLLGAIGHDVIIGLYHGTFVTTGICLVGYIVSFIGNKK